MCAFGPVSVHRLLLGSLRRWVQSAPAHGPTMHRRNWAHHHHHHHRHRPSLQLRLHGALQHKACYTARQPAHCTSRCTSCTLCCMDSSLHSLLSTWRQPYSYRFSIFSFHAGLFSTTVKHLNNFNERMRMSGYKENYRFQIIKSGVEGFDKMLEREANEGVPINKPRTYEEDQRQKKSIPR